MQRLQTQATVFRCDQVLCIQYGTKYLTRRKKPLCQMRVNANICSAFHFLPPCFLNGFLQLHSSFTELITADAQSPPCFRWTLKAIKEISNVVFSSIFDSLYCTRQALSGYLQKCFHAPYLGILYFSFHLESLDLLSYVVSLFLSFSLVSVGYDSLIFLEPIFFKFIAIFACLLYFPLLLLAGVWRKIL